MMRTLFILLRKEFILFSKNKFLPKIAFIFPCMVILVIPLVATMDVKHAVSYTHLTLPTIYSV